MKEKDEATEMLRASLLEQVNQLSDDEIISLYDNLSKFLNTKECSFYPTMNTSSATICGACGKEKFEHKL
jgi:hypothetical protein